ncbi:MAG: cupin domain-containing protein [Gemmatimonadota bacterium]
MIPMPISTDTADHYSWGGTCEGWHLVKAAGLSVIEERMPPGTCEVPHWHARARQFFYVLSGTMVIEVEGTRHEISAGQGIELAQGTAHQARNDGTEDIRFLVISSPPHRGDRRETTTTRDTELQRHAEAQHGK